MSAKRFMLKIQINDDKYNHIICEPDECLADVIPNYISYKFFDKTNRPVLVNEQFKDYPEERFAPQITSKIIPIPLTQKDINSQESKLMQSVSETIPIIEKPKVIQESKPKPQKQQDSFVKQAITVPTVIYNAAEKEEEPKMQIKEPEQDNSAQSLEKSVESMKEMGIDAARALEALNKSNGDLQKAISLIFEENNSSNPNPVVNLPPPPPAPAPTTSNDNIDPTYITTEKITEYLNTLTAQEKDAVHRLHGKGFSMPEVIQIFEACGHNEATAEMLLSNS